MRFVFICLPFLVFSCGTNEKKASGPGAVFNEEAEFQKGGLFLQEMKADSAIAVFENIVQKGREKERAYCGLGISLLLKREPQKALSAFEKALQEEPESYDAMTGIGSAYLDLHEYEKSLEYFRLAQKTDPTMLDGNRNLVIVFDKLNQPDSALVYAKKYVETVPDAQNDFDIQQIVKKHSKR